MAGPKPGGDKQKMQDAFSEATAEQGPNVAPDDPSAGGDPSMGGGGQDVKELALQLQHISNILIQKGILSPQDVISPPQLGAVPPPGAPPMPPGPPGMPPGGPPMGAPPGPPMMQ